MTFSQLQVITVKCEEIQMDAGLENTLNPKLSFRRAVLTFCLLGATTCLS